MAYTPYSQALPDTSRYTLDPVLQERLYQPVRLDPYQVGMLSTKANDYYADPVGYTNRLFGNLDEVLETDKTEVSLGGMFAPLLQNNSQNNSDGENGGLTPEQIAFLDAEAATFGARDGRMGKINSMLSLVAQGIVPGMTALSIAQMGPTAYADMMQGHARNVAGDITGYKGTDSRMPAREAGKAAPVVSGAYVDAINQGLTPDQASNVEAGGGGYSGPGGVGGTGVSLGGGNAADGYGIGGW
jgi:hypothetical protein